MTDNEIRKALSDEDIVNVLSEFYDLDLLIEPNLNEIITFGDVLDLINRKNAEIERLTKRLNLADACIDEVDDALYRGSHNDWAEQAIENYNNLVKEMVGE